MSMKAVASHLQEKVMGGENFTIKFVDIGSGSKKLNEGVVQAEKSDKFMQALS